MLPTALLGSPYPKAPVAWKAAMDSLPIALDFEALYIFSFKISCSKFVLPILNSWIIQIISYILGEFQLLINTQIYQRDG